MKILVITNPLAGAGKTLRLLPKIRQWLSASPHEFSFIVPPSSEEMRLEIIKASTRGINALLFIGGDGTVHQALPAIAETNLPFGFLPCGRGNDFARNIGLASKLEKHCSLPSNPSFHQVDLPRIFDKNSLWDELRIPKKSCMSRRINRKIWEAFSRHRVRTAEDFLPPYAPYPN